MNISTAAIVREVRALAAERPEHIYYAPQRDNCSYVCDASGCTPEHGCIVGQALVRLGVPQALLAEIEVREGQDAISNMPPIVSNYGVGVELVVEQEVYWLSRVQAHQDRAVPWGESVALADAGR